MSEQSTQENGFHRIPVLDGSITIPKLTAAERAVLEARDREQQEQARRTYLRGIGVPAGYANVSLDSSQTTAAIAVVRDFLKADIIAGHCLILSGPTGVGKTFAAIAALLAACDETKRFYYFPALCNALMDLRRRGELLAKAKTVRLTVWDDFGGEYSKVGGPLESLIDELVCFREAERLPTIITTNLTRDQLHDRFSDRIVDRLGGEWGRLFHVPGNSLRRGNGDNG